MRFIPLFALILVLIVVILFPPLARAGHDDDARAALALAMKPTAKTSTCGLVGCPCGCAETGVCTCKAATDESKKPYAVQWRAEGWTYDEAGKYWWKATPANVYVPTPTRPDDFLPSDAHGNRWLTPPAQQFYRNEIHSFGRGSRVARCVGGG